MTAAGHDHAAAVEPVCVWPCRTDGGAPAATRVSGKARLWWSIGLTTATMAAEAVAGVVVGSLALVSDAGHMLTHAFALGVSLAAIALAAQAASPERTYGHHRVEILAALLNGVTLLAIAGWIGWEAVERFREPVAILDTPMLVVALVGLVVNLATAGLLHGIRKHDLNIRSAFLHVIGDTVSSVAVVVGAVVILLTGWLWIDPALSIGICLVIVVWSVGLLRDAIRVLLEVAPRGITIERILASIRDEFPAVSAIRDVHVWTVATGMVAMTAHVVVDTDSLADCCALGEGIEKHLRADFGIGHVTLQFVRRGEP